MEKISKSQIMEVLASVGPAMRKLASERDAAYEELNAYKKQAEVEKVANTIVQKGLSSEPFDKLVEQLMKVAEKGELDHVRGALEYVGPDMGERIAKVSNDESVAAYEGNSDFERYILGSY